MNQLVLHSVTHSRDPNPLDMNFCGYSCCRLRTSLDSPTWIIVYALKISKSESGVTPVKTYMQMVNPPQ